ncbi:unnamed protein product, partial [Strongylus vulgaris]
MHLLRYIPALLSFTVAVTNGFFNFTDIDMEAVGKSYHNNGNNSVIDYCAKLTVKQHPLQEELTNTTLTKASRSGMLGAPEVLTLGENFIHLIGGKKALDVGTYTGASALAWALAAGEGGKVRKKNWLCLVQRLIAEGESDTFDFAFIDADKLNYPEYYDRCVTLLRKGGVIMIDNVRTVILPTSSRCSR